MTEHLTWGLLSTARINRNLIPAIRDSSRAELVAVASRSELRATQYAEEWDIPRAHRSYQALLEDPDIDVVYVPLPNSLHAEWTVKAIEAGKHVLCEKPLALSVAECNQIIDASEAAGVIAMEAVMVLYHPLLHRARELVRSGVVGEVTMVRGAFSFLLDRPHDVRWEPALGGGSLRDIGSYPVSFIRWIAGEPDEVFGWQTMSESGIDATFAGLLRYDGRMLGAFHCSFVEPFRTMAEVGGTEGTLIIERPYPTSTESRLLLRSLGEDEAREIVAAKQDAYHYEVEALTAAVLDGAPLAVPLTSSRANVATLNALYQSARRGEPQPVSVG
ncbi:MAG: Gfo/Idh/MocA family protein [Chloroflexota bacterium]